jgi:site-specific recombinase XerD
MARNIRHSDLENRTNRLKLPISKKPVFIRIGTNLSLGYRRNQTDGTWVMRTYDPDKGYATDGIGFANDYTESGMTFFDAQNKAKELADHPVAAKPLTVGDAAANYLTVLESRNRQTAYDTKLRLQKHFLPIFADKLVSSLTKTQLEKWLAGLVDMENERASKDTANRVLTMAKALLNHALQDQSHGIKDDSAWRWVKPFRSVGQPRSIRYTVEDVEKLVDHAPDRAAGNLIKAAFLTGTRYGEMIDAKVSSINLNTGNWRVSGKTGSRDIMLQQEAVEFFRELTSGKSAADLIFTMENGQPWKKSDQTRPFKRALVAAGLPSDGSMYALRHSYISTAIEGGAPLNLIAENCGTSVRMIEKTYSHLFVEKRRSFIEAAAPSFGK